MRQRGRRKGRFARVSSQTFANWAAREGEHAARELRDGFYVSAARAARLAYHYARLSGRQKVRS